MKRSTPKYKVYLDDIMESIIKIEGYMNKVLSYKDFKCNNLITDAVVRNLEIIGEATKNLPLDIKRRYRDIEWKKISGLRDILIHEYFGINLEIVWDVVTDKIPKLKSSIKKIIKEL